MTKMLLLFFCWSLIAMDDDRIGSPPVDININIDIETGIDRPANNATPAPQQPEAARKAGCSKSTQLALVGLASSIVTAGITVATTYSTCN